MPSGFGMQRLVVFNYIEQLPADEMKRAYKLYAVLNKIEWLSFVPF